MPCAKKSIVLLCLLSAAEGAEPTPERVPTVRAPVRTMTIQAAAAQWDNDAFPDGLTVRICPVAADGTPAAVNGELTLTLRGFIHGSYRRDSFALHPQPHEFERTSHLVKPTEFIDGTAVYRLPFSRIRIDRDLEIEPPCVVHARLGVPGQGVFEAACTVLIRPWDPFVDRLPYFTGYTYPRNLITGDGARPFVGRRP